MMRRRDVLGGAGAAAVVAALPRAAGPAIAAEPPPETTTIRFGSSPAICMAPQYVAEDLLRSEGFTQVTYVKTASIRDRFKAFAAGRIDFMVTPVFSYITLLGAGDPITLLAGIHGGCYELFGSPRVHRIRELKGR